jgi:hypothetical protein
MYCCYAPGSGQITVEVIQELKDLAVLVPAETSEERSDFCRSEDHSADEPAARNLPGRIPLCWLLKTYVNNI